MSVTASTHQRQAVCGRPPTTSPRTARTVADRMVARFVDALTGEIAGDLVRAATPAITEHFLDCAHRILDGRDHSGGFPHLEKTAERWARANVPLELVLHAVHAAFKSGIDLLSRPREQVVDPGAVESLGARLELVIDLLDHSTTAVTMSYVRNMRADAGPHQTAAHTLVSALLSGHATSAQARECGIVVAQRYAVLAVHIPPPQPNPGDVVAARRTLRRVQAELATRCQGRALALLSVDGGTVLLPRRARDEDGDDDLDDLITALSAAGRTPVTAAALIAARGDIPEAADHAHQLLDSVTRLDYPSGVYRFDHMALEVQLSRPGPARDSLAAVLAPLEEFPELTELLRIHLGNNLNRQRTARHFDIHTNTVDNRLKRINELTGWDPVTGDGAWMLRSALIARGRAPGLPPLLAPS